jgi:hypothetical protein
MHEDPTSIIIQRYLDAQAGELANEHMRGQLNDWFRAGRPRS